VGGVIRSRKTRYIPRNVPDVSFVRDLQRPMFKWIEMLSHALGSPGSPHERKTP